MEKTFQELAKMFSARINTNSEGYIDSVEVNDGNKQKIIKSHHFLALKSGINIHDEETDNNDQHKVSNELRYDPDFKTFLLQLTLYNSYIGLKHTSKKAADLISEVTNHINPKSDGQSGGKRKRLKTKTNKRKRTKSKTNKRKKRTRRRR